MRGSTRPRTPKRRATRRTSAKSATGAPARKVPQDLGDLNGPVLIIDDEPHVPYERDRGDAADLGGGGAPPNDVVEEVIPVPFARERFGVEEVESNQGALRQEVTPGHLIALVREGDHAGILVELFGGPFVISGS